MGTTFGCGECVQVVRGTRKLTMDGRRSNPELYVNPGGLRLDQTTPAVQDLVHALLRASSSEAGYAKILGCCLTNEFLGQLVRAVPSRQKKVSLTPPSM